MINQIKQYLLTRTRRQKRLIIILIDSILLLGVLWIALSLGKNQFLLPVGNEWLVFPLMLIVTLPIFFKFGIYKAVLRYLKNQTISTILLSTLISTLVWAVIVKFSGLLDLTKSGVLLYWLGSFSLIAGSRLQVQKWLYGAPKITSERKKVYIYGAGEAGTKLAALLSNEAGYFVEGFIDDDQSLKGWTVQGVTVSIFDKVAPVLMTEAEDTEVILAMPKITRMQRQFIIERLEPFPIKVRIIPNIGDFASGKLSVSDIKDIDIDDLLGREPINPDPELLPANITGKLVLITGAGGSIGSELCRQALKLKPSKLVLVELSEFALYQIDQELSDVMRELDFDVEIERILGSCGDRKLLDGVFDHNKVQTIYHAAAYKHVPLVEENPVAGLNNNIFGTKALAEKALESQVETFILISTDKAVRPTNIMGCSKRVAEMTLQALAATKNCNTKFSMVRFGNVLGSSGSVVPKFRQQIAEGGPITITHKDITRYFMSIPEAVQLVIQAGAMAEGGNVFVLDMGDSVKIVDLAKKMISLSGLELKDEHNLGGDIELAYSGLRPGEKLYEELLIGDNVKGTRHSRIMQASEEYLDMPDLQELLNNLKVALSEAEKENIKISLTTIVDGYTPWKESSTNAGADGSSNVVDLNVNKGK